MTVDKEGMFLSRIAVNIQDKTRAEQAEVLKRYDNSTQLEIYKLMERLKHQKGSKR